MQVEPVEPGFPIDYLGMVWEWGSPSEQGGLPGESGVAVRFRVEGIWGPWRPLAGDDLQAPGRWVSRLVPGGDADAYQVRDLPFGSVAPRVVALNTTDGPPSASVSRRAATAAATACLSRAEWGADESLRFVGGEESWPVDFRAARVMTVHHTATPNAGSDPAATVRAIYFYHTVTLGWGDIGYHYLIDETGRIYEGRWSGEPSRPCGEGGDGSDFGHDPAGQVVTAGHTYCYNRGNLGAALLGDFSATLPQAPAKVALEALLADNAARHDLDPLGTVYYAAPGDIPACAGVVDASVEVIAGHTDWPDPAGDTSCPGAMLHSQLHAVRANVAGVLPAAFAKVSPADEANGQSIGVALSWTPALGADGYEYCYDTSDDGTCSPWVAVGPASGAQIGGLEYGTTYYWQVRAVNATGAVPADGGAFWQFTTAAPVLLEETFLSWAQYDGRVRERDEDSGRGYSWSDVGAGRVGDDSSDRQYRSILHFDTSRLRDDAVVVGATLKIRRAGRVGENPMLTHGLLVVDLKAGAFHDDPLLERFDFHAVGSRGNVGRFIKTPVYRWYRAPLRPPAWELINRTGPTQLRLRFRLDDDDDLTADYLSFFAGDADPEYRPQLIITYYLPSPPIDR